MHKKVLVVEDDIDMRQVLARMLRRHGYSVIEAEHGKEAAELLHDGLEPCLILTDWVMPGNGADLIKYLRACDTLILIPIVITTATPELPNATVLHGVKVLKKPVVSEVILSLVAQYCCSDKDEACASTG